MVEELKRRLMHRPFRKFRIVLDRGERLDVARQFQVGIGLTEFLYVSPDYSRKLHLKLEQIAALDAPDTARAS